MPARIKWLRTALQNFDAEMAHIASDSPQAARLVARRIREAIDVLSVYPSAGRPGRIAGTRELVVPKTRYLIPYRVRGGVVEILRVFHVSRRPPGKW